MHILHFFALQKNSYNSYVFWANWKIPVPITIYWSRSIMWYPQNTRGHMSRVSKRVWKLVNFTVQYLKKPDLFDLTDNFPNSPEWLWCWIHCQTPSINCFTYIFALAPCVKWPCRKKSIVAFANLLTPLTFSPFLVVLVFWTGATLTEPVSRNLLTTLWKTLRSGIFFGCF